MWLTIVRIQTTVADATPKEKINPRYKVGIGASALGQVVELTLQLRGDAGPRQVPGARTGLAHTVGRGANASVVVLKR